MSTCQAQQDYLILSKRIIIYLITYRFIFSIADTGSDIFIMLRYYVAMQSGRGHNSTILPNTPKECQDTDEEINKCADDVVASWNAGIDTSIYCIAKALTDEQKFAYTLFFLLVPWPFFIYEFFTSTQYHQYVTKGKEIVNEMSHCNGFGSLLRCYLKAILHCIAFLSCLLFWPIAVLFIKYYSDGKYYLAKGMY